MDCPDTCSVVKILEAGMPLLLAIWGVVGPAIALRMPRAEEKILQAENETLRRASQTPPGPRESVA